MSDHPLEEQQQAEGKELFLDEKTGEMVSKNEFKRRQKQQRLLEEKAAKAKASGKPASNQLGADDQSNAQMYYETRLKEIQQAKIDGKQPYPYKIHVTMSVSDFRSKYNPIVVEQSTTLFDCIESVSGRVMSVRSAGQTLVFLAIEETSVSLQVFCSKDAQDSYETKKFDVKKPTPNLFTLSEQNILEASNYQALCGTPSKFFDQLDSVKRGDVICVTGFPTRTKTGELSIAPLDVQLIAPCLHTLPKANAKVTDIEYRYLNRSVDLFFNRKNLTLVRRIKCQQFIKDFFIKTYDFLEVETPILHPIKGGANAKPFVTYYNDLGQEVFLRIAPELYLKQLVMGGLNRVFEMNRNFRNESIDQTHLPEFTMLECYCAYWDLYDMMIFVEQLLSGLAKYINVTFNNQEDSADNKDLYVINYTDWNKNAYKIDFRPPFKRFEIMSGLEEQLSIKLKKQVQFPRPYSSAECNTYIYQLIHTELFNAQIIKKADLPKAPFTTTRMIDYLVGEFLEKLTHNPMFLLHHPKIMSPLAKPHRKDGEITERFEVFCAMFELCNAYTELNDSQIQRENFEEQVNQKKDGDDEVCDTDEGFLRAMEHGMVPQSGLGIGIDRLMMLMCGENSIREVTSFPLLRAKKDEQGNAQ